MKDMYQLTGISPSYISRIESGTRRSPSLPIVKRIADALDVPLEKLIGLEVDESNGINTVYEVILSNDFIISDNKASQKSKEILVDLLEIIFAEDVDIGNRNQNLFLMLELIDEFKESL